MMIERLKEALEPLKKELTQHPLYENIDTIECLKTFMEYHVYAVSDFMSLVKKLQIDLTSTNLPWVPPKNNSAARFINEIVWGEETDLDENGTAVSHFEMYINAMQQINANTLGIEETQTFSISTQWGDCSAAEGTHLALSRSDQTPIRDSVHSKLEQGLLHLTRSGTPSSVTGVQHPNC